MSTLTDQQLQALKKILLEREARIRSQIHTDIEHRALEPYSELAGEVADEGDASVADVIVDFDNSMIQLRLAELREIEAARERIQEDDYGACSECDQPIQYERLVAYPTAQRCVPCQSMYERTHVSTRYHATL